MLHNPAWTYRQTGPVLATFLDRHPAVPRERRAPPRVLIERVAAWHGVDAAAILSHRRHARDVQARFDAIAAVKMAYPAISFARLGRLFDRDHTTIMHALRKRGLR
jgi:chromosomal replication initiation ATPase DnaA